LARSIALKHLYLILTWVLMVNPNVFSHPFTLFSSNVFFASIYLALPFIFMTGVDLGLMKIKKITELKSDSHRESEKVKSNSV
jgi:hypothetical protein